MYYVPLPCRWLLVIIADNTNNNETRESLEHGALVPPGAL
jgi:hypothetical protein